MGALHIVIEQSAPSFGWGALFSWLIGKVLPPLIAGCGIALLGSWLLARLNEAHKGKREHLVRTAELLLSTMAELQSLSASYWAQPAGPETIPMEPVIEYKLQLLNVLQDTCARELPEKHRDAISLLFVRLMEETCPHQFGQAGRAAESDRGMVIAGLMSRLANEVIEGRRSVVHADQLAQWWNSPVSRPSI